MVLFLNAVQADHTRLLVPSSLQCASRVRSLLKIDIAASQGQGPVNEDCVGYAGAAAWVIDGATGVGGQLTSAPSDAAWLAQTANRLLTEAFAADPQEDSRTLLRSVLAACRDALAREQVRAVQAAHELPSAAFAMVRVLGGEVEITTLADCRVVARDAKGIARLYGSSPLDARADAMGAAIREMLLRDPGMSRAQLVERLMPDLQAMRRTMNREGGYWVLGTEPAAADHVWQARLPLQHGARFAIASDGFLRLHELFGALAPEDFLALESEGSWLAALEGLRELERAPDPQQRFARVKAHDDASLIVCRWDEAA